jgi:hypothetical protein
MLESLFYLVIILILIYLLSSNESKDKFFCSPATLYNKSIGTFDGPAKAALSILENKSYKSTNDKLLEATIISESILEGETPLRSPHTINAANKYTEALRNPADNIENHLLDTAEVFNVRLANTVLTQADLFPDDDDIFNEFDLVIGNLGENINLARQTQAAAIKQYQREISNTSNESITNYLTDIKSYTSDPQNSHDTTVSKEIRNSLDIIESNISNNKSADFVFSDIIEFIRRSDITTPKKQRAKHALEVIKERNNEVFAANRNEIEVVRLVWLRADHPKNTANEENIKSAILDALVDITNTNSWNETDTVCPNGRISRIVGALSTLDFNDNVGALQTSEQINNYILDQASHVYNSYVEANPGPIVDALNTKEGPVEGPELNRFNAGLKRAVDKMLLENNATDVMKQKVYIGFDF